MKTLRKIARESTFDVQHITKSGGISLLFVLLRLSVSYYAQLLYIAQTYFR